MPIKCRRVYDLGGSFDPLGLKARCRVRLQIGIVEPEVVEGAGWQRWNMQGKIAIRIYRERMAFPTG